MAFPDVDGLQHSLRQFAERTNDLVCSANTRLEFLVNNHHPSVLSASGLAEAATSSSRSAKRARLSKYLDAGAHATQSEAEGLLSPSPLSEEATLRPRLPIEILDGIFCFFAPHELQPVLLTNSFIFPVAQRRFYQSVAVESPLQCLSLLKSLLANPQLPPLVRSLDLNISTTSTKRPSPRAFDGGDARDNDELILTNSINATTNSINAATSSLSTVTTTTAAHPTGNFYRLLARALRAMDGLRSLSLELPKSHSPLWIFDGCVFKLRQFTTSMHCHRPLARFLERQDGIVDLTLRGFQHESLFFLPFLGHLGAAAAAAANPPVSPTAAAAGEDGDSDMDLDAPMFEHTFRLLPTALPHLTHFNAIHAGPSVVRSVVQGRPIAVASLPLFPDISLSTLDALGMGSTPLKRLSLISFDPTAPGFLFEQLASRYRDLEALHLVMLMADYTKSLLEESGRVLAKFTALKYITFMAASTDESSTIDESSIARQWHRACPTLRTIILPKGRVWFQGDTEVDFCREEDE